MKKIAALILNRNLPKITDRLVNNLKKNDKDIVDIFVIEAGSDKNNLSKNTTWYVKDKFTMKNGLRYPRGMNFGLFNLYKEKKLLNYEAVLLMTNDTNPPNKKFIRPLFKELKSNNKIGIISPCGDDWGEREYLNNKEKTKFFYYIHNHVYLININLIKKIANFKSKSYKNFFFDGNNFRGFGTESELIAKCYANDYAAAITSKVLCSENEYFLKKYYKYIKTESYDINKKLYLKEGSEWMKKKYGFSSKWDMLFYGKNFYDKFFEYYPNLLRYKI